MHTTRILELFSMPTQHLLDTVDRFHHYPHAPMCKHLFERRLDRIRRKVVLQHFHKLFHHEGQREGERNHPPAGAPLSITIGTRRNQPRSRKHSSYSAFNAALHCHQRLEDIQQRGCRHHFAQLVYLRFHLCNKFVHLAGHYTKRYALELGSQLRAILQQILQRGKTRAPCKGLQQVRVPNGGKFLAQLRHRNAVEPTRSGCSLPEPCQRCKRRLWHLCKSCLCLEHDVGVAEMRE
mmetsp:Transcript_34422/g.65779  ORF Transcript_34422/g.65779 Transcript_34422/m.65779 type:complete len:236 (-) Transcript_34422:1816-2523(-)